MVGLAHGLLRNFAQHLLTQTGHQHQVPFAQEGYGGLKLGGIFVAEVGQHNYQRALVLYAGELLSR